MKRRRRQKDIWYSEMRTAREVPLFVQPVIAEKLISGLKWSCENRGLRIYDYAILPDRLLIIGNTAWGNLSDVLDSFMEFSSKAVMLMLKNGNPNLQSSWMVSLMMDDKPGGKLSGSGIWHKEVLRNHLFRQDGIDSASQRIQNAPVAMGWVVKAEHYRYSSACPANPLEGWIVEAVDPWS
ncbi:hypothetical protein [Rhodohalobacter mucosus]|uniref:Uncharacterized protein n=1 Tax=Rhodohalobacter mucosus TaxID=2079485 RepID=A0A316TM21_9BACT|nr:hypothetical protein [Rhodohalobacter mucosus]PWN05627.1 hypothetical protein DDZ15_13600 [Rhodohalobacter mucosus]